MPLARIVTSTPDQVASLSLYLRSRGYTVELVYPEALRNLPMEQKLDLRGSEEALASATYVTEGANSGRRVIAYDITGRPVEFADEESETTASSNAGAGAWQVLRSARRTTVESLRRPFLHLRESLTDGRRSLEEYRARYQQLRARAAAQAEEHRRERRAQREALEAERSRQQMERVHRQARIDMDRESSKVETRQPKQDVTRDEVALAYRDANRRQQLHGYRRDHDLQKAAVVAAALALLAITGLAAYRNRVAVPLLSNRNPMRSQDVSRTISFDAATAAVHPSATERTVSGRSDRAQAAQPVSRKIDAAVKPTAALATVRKRPVHRVHSEEDEFIAEDEVIIHRPRPSGAAQARSKLAAQPRRISDLDK